MRRRSCYLLLTALPLLLSWAAPALALEGGEAGEGAAEAAPHWATMAWKGFNFAVLVVLLAKFLAAPIKGYFTKRRDDIRAQLAAAEAARAEAVAKLREIEHKLSSAESEAAELMKKAESESTAERERLIAAAREEADRMRVLAQDEIRRATDAARAELRAYAAELATARAEQIVASQIQDGDRKRLFAEYVANLEKGMPA